MLASIPYDDKDELGNGGQSHCNSLVVSSKYFTLPHIRRIQVTPDEHFKILRDFQRSAEMFVR